MTNITNNQAEEITQLIHELSELKKHNTELSDTGFKLISTQTKLHSLLHNASDGIITFSADGTVETFNKAAQHIFGYSKGEIVTRKIPNLIPCPDWAKDNVAAYIRHFISSRTSAETPLVGKHRMGFDILLYVTTGQASNEETLLFGEPDQDPFADDLDTSEPEKNDQVTVCFFRDITVNKKIEIELAEHKFALDLAAGIIIRNKDFRVIDINEKFCKILRRHRYEFVGEQFIQSKFSGIPDNEEFLQLRRKTLSQGNPWVGEACFLNIEGEQVWFTESITPFFDEYNIPYQYLSILIDITETKKNEEQLKQRSNNLQTLVDEQLIGIKQARDTAENANKVKSEFLANMSHELRTPMHAILSFTHLGLKQFKTLPLDSLRTEKLQNFLNNIESSSQRLLSLLNNLLDLSKLESGKEAMELKNHDLYLLSQQIQDEFLAKIQEKQLNFIINTPTNPQITLCDKNKILQVLGNLTANAIKFSAEKKSIFVDIEAAQIVLGKRATDIGKTEGVLLSFTDQGVGIPENELLTVFDKFIQSSKTKNGAGGTGLGLSICHEIISAHKGKIWAEHNPEGGAIFKLFLPYNPSKLY
jgi:PAS domain S-box-containing protein